MSSNLFACELKCSNNLPLTYVIEVSSNQLPLTYVNKVSSNHLSVHISVKVSFFGGESVVKMATGVHCDGEEQKLSDCYHDESGATVTCPRRDMVAGVVCATGSMTS